MADALSVAIYRAKVCKAPSVVNIWQGNQQLELKINEMNAHVATLQQQNAELRGRNGGLTRQIVNLGLRYEAAVKERDAAIAGKSEAVSELENRNYEFIPLRATLADIMEVVSIEFGINVRDMKSEFRNRDIVLARQVCMYLQRLLIGCPVTKIARWFNRDHTTVMHAIEKIKALRVTDMEFDAKIAGIEQKFRTDSLDGGAHENTELA